jgi:hypothetical protein
MPSSRRLIASNTLGSSAASVTFSSIPGTYTDLVLLISARTDQANPTATFLVRYNGSSAANYSATYLYTGGSTPTSYRDTNATSMEEGGATANTGTASTFGSTEIYIPNYAGNTNKPNSSFYVGENNSSTVFLIGAAAGLRSVTDAITSIGLLTTSGNFVSGSSFFLYGLSNT